MTELEAMEPWANDATDVSPTPSSARGAQLMGLSISFTVKLPAESWRPIGPAVGYPEWDPAKHALQCYALPVRVEALVPYVSIGMHIHRGDDPEAHWDLSWDRAISDKPPARLRELARVPFPEVMDRLAEVWPSSEPVDAAVTGEYLVLENRWKVPTAVPLKLGKGLPVLHPSAWTLRPASGAVRWMSVSSEKDFGVVTVGGRCRLSMTRLVFNEVDRSLWTGLSNILEPRSLRKESLRSATGGKRAPR